MFDRGPGIDEPGCVVVPLTGVERADEELAMGREECWRRDEINPRETALKSDELMVMLGDAWWWWWW